MKSNSQVFGALLPEELERHLMFDAARLRGSEAASIGLIIRDAMPNSSVSHGVETPQCFKSFGMCTERVCLLSFCCFSFIVMMMSLHLGSGPLSLTCCVCLMAMV